MSECNFLHQTQILLVYLMYILFSIIQFLQVGDFIFPFEFSGGLCLIVGLVTILRLPKLVGPETLNASSSSDSSPTSSSSLTSLRAMLAEPKVLLALLGTVFGAVCQGFIETFLESYLALFDLSVSQIGVSFLGMFSHVFSRCTKIFPISQPCPFLTCLPHLSGDGWQTQVSLQS